MKNSKINLNINTIQVDLDNLTIQATLVNVILHMNTHFYKRTRRTSWKTKYLIDPAKYATVLSNWRWHGWI